MIGDIVSSIRTERLGDHVHISVWNRGGKAGELVVLPGDAPVIVMRLTDGAAGGDLSGLVGGKWEWPCRG